MTARSHVHERRREPRAPERIALAVSDAGTELATETKNLSATGTYCTVDRFIAPMSKLALQFALPNHGTRPTHIRCTGVVVRVDPVITHAERGRYNVAVLFTELTPRDRAAIARFVRQRLAHTSSTR